MKHRFGVLMAYLAGGCLTFSGIQDLQAKCFAGGKSYRLFPACRRRVVGDGGTAGEAHAVSAGGIASDGPAGIRRTFNRAGGTTGGRSRAGQATHDGFLPLSPAIVKPRPA